jgi:hypothetical protein
MLHFAVPQFPTRARVDSRRTLNIVAAIALLAICGALLSCSSSSSNQSSQTSQLPPNISGAWEFVAVSNDGSITGVEVALTEGQELDNGIEVPSGQISANSTQIAFVSLNTVSQNLNITSFGGSCNATPTSGNSLGPGSVTALSEPISFTFTANGSVFNVSAMLDGTGQNVVNGTYTPQTGNACSDPGGTITGTEVAKISGTFAGKMCPLADAPSDCESSQDLTDAVTATISESNSGTMTMSLIFTAGPDSGANATLTGPVTGDAFTVQGTYQGQSLVYYGYYEQITKSGSNVPSLYLVNSTDTTVPIAVLSLQPAQP